MEITQIIVRKRFQTGGLAAVVSIIINNQLAIHDVKVAYRPDGELLVIMPKDKWGRDVVHPLTKSIRAYFEAEITKKTSI